MHQALYGKWRPRVFSEVSGQPHITAVLRNQAARGSVSHAYLFCGTHGTGKTTCARILAKAAVCLGPQDGDPCNICDACRAVEEGTATDISEIDAASNNGVDNIRDLRDEAAFTPAQLKRRVYIIDEVHMLSTGAFNALLKILEEPPAHVMFILATTEAHKLPATILSRCQRYDFRRIPAGEISARLLYVAEREHVTLLPDAAALIAGIANGAMRNALTLLEKCIMAGGDITRERVNEAAGLASHEELFALFRELAAHNASGVMARFSAMYIDGASPSAVLGELALLCRDLLAERAGGQVPYAGAWHMPERLAELARLTTAERMVEALSDILDTEARLARAADARIEAELCLIRLCGAGGGQPSPAGLPPVGTKAETAVITEPEAVPPPDPPPAEHKAAPPADTAPADMQAPAVTAMKALTLSPEFFAGLKGQVPSAVAANLRLCTVQLENGALTVICPGETVLKMTDKPEITAALQSYAGAGGDTVCSVSFREANEKPDALGALTDMLSANPELGQVE